MSPKRARKSRRTASAAVRQGPRSVRPRPKPPQPAPEVAPAPTVDGRRRRHLHRRPQLLRAAVAAVERQGLAALSLRPLAAELGISATAVLHHFGSKEAFEREVVRTAHFRALDGLMQRLRRRGRTASLLRAELLAQLAEAPSALTLLFEAQVLSLRDAERFRGFRQQIVDDWLQLLESGLRRDGAPPRRARALATLLLDAARGLALDHLSSGDGARVRSGFDALVRLVESELRPRDGQA